MSEWLTVKEAAEALKCSTRHVRSRAATGKLRARKEGNIWLIHSSLSKPLESENVPLVPSESVSESERITSLLEENRWLKERVENQEKDLSELRRELAESSTRHDTIIMQMISASPRLRKEKMIRQLSTKLSFFKRLFGGSKK